MRGAGSNAGGLVDSTGGARAVWLYSPKSYFVVGGGGGVTHDTNNPADYTRHLRNGRKHRGAVAERSAKKNSVGTGAVCPVGLVMSRGPRWSMPYITSAHMTLNGTTGEPTQ